MSSMKRLKSFFFIFVLLSCISCSIEKRHYMSGYNVNWKTFRANQLVKSSDNIISSKEDGSEICLDKNDDGPIMASNDSTLTIISQKSELQVIDFSSELKETPKSKSEKMIPKKNKKPIDPKKDSKASLLLGVFAICLIVFGVALLLLVLSFSSFSYILYMLAMLSILAALVFGIIGIIKALKTLNYLKSNPEESKKNKRIAITGLILNTLVLLPLLLVLVYFILASMSR